MKEKSRISVSIIGYNEALNLPQCFEALGWADEIIFVDCQSEDNSIEIAKHYTNKIFSRPNLENLNINKSFAIDQTSSPWVLYLDPDELITEEAAIWIRKEIQNPKYDAYLFPRKNHILGSWLKFGSQYPDYQLRLFRKDKAHFPCKHVHERLQVNGLVGKSQYPMLHFPYPELNIFLKKFNYYTTFEAKFLLENHPSKLSWINFILLKPLLRFLKRYLLKGGFLDGFPGFVAAFFDMISFPVRYFKYIELKKKITSKDTEKNL